MKLFPVVVVSLLCKNLILTTLNDYFMTQTFLFNLYWFKQPFIFVSSKVSFAKLWSEECSYKQFPKMQKQLFTNVLQNRCFYKSPNVHRKISVLKSLCNTGRGLKVHNINKKETPRQVFSCEYHKIFKNRFFMEQL